jgi:ubiquinone/menaquinone biosynthesis C-methylase UbiE
MDALGIKPGSVVADVGCGDGYFTLHLASRVGPQGKVYGEDIDYKGLSKINHRAYKEHLSQIELILGSAEDPRLPSGALDAILVVEAYHEMDKHDAMLQGMSRALKPGGLLGIIDRNARPRRPRSTYQNQHRIPKELVREDATRNSFQFRREERGFKTPKGKRKYYFLIFQKA